MAKRFESDEPEPVTPTPIDPLAVMDRLTAALEAMSARQSASPDDRVAAMMEQLSTALTRLAEANVQGSQLIASETRRAHRPSNEVVPGISVFNRRGTMIEGAKPPLKCVMLIPWLAEWESLTREEVELLNLLEPGDYVMQRADRSRVGGVTVRVDYKSDNVTPSRLIMSHETAFNNENFRLNAPLPDMLRFILGQHPESRKLAAAVLTDDEEAALIEAGELTVSK